MHEPMAMYGWECYNIIIRPLKFRYLMLKLEVWAGLGFWIGIMMGLQYILMTSQYS